MNDARAKQILLSPHLVNVTYNGSRIYMEKVDSASETCRIHYLNQPEKTADVPLSSLIEH